jgi:Tol biopolymer transport system component
MYSQRNRKGLSGLDVMNADGSSLVQITAFEFNPRWSPDGSTIVFRNEIAVGESDIYVIPATGGYPHRLTT